MKEITRDTVIADILNSAPDSAPMFLEMGTHCPGCVMAGGETVGEACEVHGVNADEFLAKINAFVNA